MKNKFGILFVIALILGMIFGIIETALTSQAQEPMQRKIVVFKTGVLNKPEREALVRKFGGVKVKDLDLISGKAILLSPRAEKALREDPSVLRIDDDVIVEALVRNDKDININVKALAIQPAEKLPWGVDRIDADLIWNRTTGDPIKVAIVDTGIDVKHPILKIISKAE